MGNFFRRLDITSTMVMESCWESGGITHSASNAFGTVDEYVPLGHTQTHLWCDATSILRTHQISAIGISKNNERKMIISSRVCNCSEQSRYFQCLRFSISMCIWIFQGHWYKSTNHC